MDNNIEKAKKLGYVETILKRKRFLHNINSGNATMRGLMNEMPSMPPYKVVRQI